MSGLLQEVAADFGCFGPERPVGSRPPASLKLVEGGQMIGRIGVVRPIHVGRETHHLVFGVEVGAFRCLSPGPQAP